jgi:RDD family
VPEPEPTAPSAPSTSPVPTLEPMTQGILDLLSEPRVPKPNPRVAKPVEKETLPPRKSNPRVINPSTPQDASIRTVEPPASNTPRVKPSPNAPESVHSRMDAPSTPRARPITPMPAIEMTASPGREVSAARLARDASKSPKPASNPLSKSPRASAKPVPRATPTTSRLPSLPKPAFKLPNLNAAMAAVRSRIEANTAASTARDRRKPRAVASWDLLRRRLIASLVDAVAVLVLGWLVTRFVGGRELETLLRFPNSARADLGLLQTLKDLLPAIISSSLMSVIVSILVGAAYFVGFVLSPLRGTLGERVAGVETVDVSGAPPTLMALAARYAVGVMLLIAPPILGLLPTLVALNGQTATLRTTMSIFGFSLWVGGGLLVIGQLPVFGGRGQSLNEYLSDCKTQLPIQLAVARSDPASTRDS